eukprot:Lithocolla_globosa_v1_NODE_1400_length_2608_cov_3.206032.p3 type:complete len:145 gc:universal NODE_1400_length_2608_cov_3.206032:2309-1875(-)
MKAQGWTVGSMVGQCLTLTSCLLVWLWTSMELGPEQRLQRLKSGPSQKNGLVTFLIMLTMTGVIVIVAFVTRIVTGMKTCNLLVVKMMQRIVSLVQGFVKHVWKVVLIVTTQLVVIHVTLAFSFIRTSVMVTVPVLEHSTEMKL